MRIWKEFCFDSSHLLPNLPAEHQCRRLHGHTYRVRLHLSGPLDPTLGWIVDFGGLLAAAGDLIKKTLDHRHLNDVPDLENPTAELVAMYIWRLVRTTQLRDLLVAVELFESSTTGVWYDG